MGAWNDTPEPGEDLTCPDCEGEGTNYVDTSRQCQTRMNDCCGGCGYDVDCETCNGTGEIEPSEPDGDAIYESLNDK